MVDKSTAAVSAPPGGGSRGPASAALADTPRATAVRVQTRWRQRTRRGQRFVLTQSHRAKPIGVRRLWRGRGARGWAPPQPPGLAARPAGAVRWRLRCRDRVAGVESSRKGTPGGHPRGGPAPRWRPVTCHCLAVGWGVGGPADGRALQTVMGPQPTNSRWPTSATNGGACAPMVAHRRCRHGCKHTG